MNPSLPEDLRTVSNVAEVQGRYVFAELMREAADEIDRLRKVEKEVSDEHRTSG